MCEVRRPVDFILLPLVDHYCSVKCVWFLEQNTYLGYHLGGIHALWIYWIISPMNHRVRLIAMAILIKVRHLAGECPHLVDRMGFEPTTSAMRVRRSSD